MTRLFGHYKCSVCNCIPQIGWIYTCTQDNESAPQPTTGMSTAMAEDGHWTAIPEEDRRAADQLSGWVVQAMTNGHYTVEQVELLKAQKRKVNETITALTRSLRLENGHVTVNSPPGSLTSASTSLPVVAINTTTSVQTVTDIAKAKSTLSVAEQLARVGIDLAPECRWSCCHRCRPMYRDRSWQSVDGVLAGDTAEDISKDWGERRVTHVNIARNLGLRKPRLSFDCFGGLRTESSDENGGVFPCRNFGQTDGEGEEQEGDESTVGFRASVKRAFRGMLMSRRRDSSSSAISTKSKGPSSEHGEDTDEFDVGEMNNQPLREAAEVRLPGEDGTDWWGYEDMVEVEFEDEDGVVVSLLSTTAGLDTTLLTLNYLLVLLHAQLTALSTRRLSHAAHALAAKASTTLLPGETLIATLTTAPSSPLLRSSRALRALADLVADVRVFLRLWGLLGIWSWGAATWRAPPRDGVLKGVAWAQIVVNAAYQVLENGAYLGQHGVVGGEEARWRRWGVWSARFWMAHVVLDLGRLVRERAVWGRRRERGEGKGKGVGEERGGKVGREKVRVEERWWREVCVNAAYAPLTVHWSLERGCVSEAWVGALGLVAGAVRLRELWAETA